MYVDTYVYIYIYTYIHRNIHARNCGEIPWSEQILLLTGPILNPDPKILNPILPRVFIYIYTYPCVCIYTHTVHLLYFSFGTVSRLDLDGNGTVDFEERGPKITKALEQLDVIGFRVQGVGISGAIIEVYRRRV